MSTDIQRLVNPATGELLELTAPTPDLGQLVYDLREHKRLVDEAIRVVSREVLNRCDQQAKWTLTFPGVKITGKSPQNVEEWDGLELREALLELCDGGLLTVEAVDGAVEQVVSWKVRKAGVSALRKLGGTVAETINRLCRTSEPERRIGVTRV